MANRTVPVLGLAALAAVVPVALLHFVGREAVDPGGWIHFGGVALGAGVATASAVALTVAGARERDGHAVLVGSAFSVMAALLCLHGLATPGILVGMNGVVAFTGGATLPVGGAILALGVIPALRRPSAVRPLLVLLSVGIALILALGVAALLEPSLVPPVPEPRSPLALVVLAAGMAFFALLFWRALRTFRLTRRPGDLVVAVGTVWLASALPAALLLGWRDLGWWLGHGFEIVGIAIVGIPVVLDLLRGAACSRPLLGDLRGADLVAAEEAFLGSHVRALLVDLAEKDAYTEEHTRRVALRAAQVGEELGLAPERLRDLAVGGLLHDIGKLSIPDEILKRPGPLSQPEFELVEEHPERGKRLLRDLGGFSESVLRLVCDHHERLDGSGYPQGLGRSELELDTRILSVCDVYDALMSRRVYRAAWTHDEAIRLLRGSAGTIFDARCVSALELVLARERADELAVAV
ncbi:MAG: HD domain-containing protein [Actinobacteria bacterium]|nr:HD domain-containing protein [Actinomycetota bacterium]